MARCKFRSVFVAILLYFEVECNIQPVLLSILYILNTNQTLTRFRTKLPFQHRDIWNDVTGRRICNIGNRRCQKMKCSRPEDGGWGLIRR